MAKQAESTAGTEARHAQGMEEPHEAAESGVRGSEIRAVGDRQPWRALRATVAAWVYSTCRRRVMEVFEWE